MKFIIRDMLFSSKLIPLINTRGLIDSASLKNHHNNRHNSGSHKWPKTCFGWCTLVEVASDEELGHQITGKPSVRPPEGCPGVPYRPPCLEDNGVRIRWTISNQSIRIILSGDNSGRKRLTRRFPWRHGPWFSVDQTQKNFHTSGEWSQQPSDENAW